MSQQKRKTKMSNLNSIQFEKFSSVEDAKDYVLEMHEAGYCYHNISVNGVCIIIRSNKDHGMNQGNNWDSCHVLSLATDCSSYSGEKNGFWIQQENIGTSFYTIEDLIWEFIENCVECYPVAA